MSFQIADVINGRNLLEGQPVVAFIVNAQGGHQPLQDNPNALGNRSSHFFAIESFPIFGTAGERSRIEVDDESHLSVRLALQLTGTQDWKELSNKAFHSRAGVRLLGRPDPEDRPHVTTRRVYGLCVMHRDTYDHLVLKGRSPLAVRCASDGYQGEYRAPADKQQDIRTVKDILTGFMQSPANIWRRPDGGADSATSEFRHAFDIARICALSSDVYLRNELLPNMDNLPTLLHALDSSDGQQLGSDFREVLRARNFLGVELLKQGGGTADDVPDLHEFLDLMWDCMHLRTRMYEIHAHFFPSFYAGQDRNFPSVLEMARSTLEQVWAEYTENELGPYSSEGAGKELDAELDRAEKVVHAMRAQLKKAREGYDRLST